MSEVNQSLYFKATASINQGAVYGEDGRTIAVLYDKTDGYGELFAKAPEMALELERLRAVNAELLEASIMARRELWAVEKLLKDGEIISTPVMDALELAIAKAEGRS